jgi:hypothetical protein
MKKTKYERVFNFIFNENSSFDKFEDEIEQLDNLAVSKHHFIYCDLYENNKTTLNGLNHFYKLLHLYYRDNTIKFINRKEKKIYRIFKNEFLKPVSENIYEKVRSNVINYYIETPCNDIFEIAFNRFLNNGKIFGKYINKFVENMDLKDKNELITFYFSNDNDEFYISLSEFRSILNDISTVPINKYTMSNNGDSITINIATDGFDYGKNWFNNYIKTIFVNRLRKVLLDNYMRDIVCEKEKYFNNILVDITGFFVRNSISLNEQVTNIANIINKELLPNIGDISDVLFCKEPKMLTEEGKQKVELKVKIPMYEYVKPIYDLLGKCNAISKSSDNFLADTYVDTDELTKKFNDIIPLLGDIRKKIDEKINEKYINGGFYDVALNDVIYVTYKKYITEVLFEFSNVIRYIPEIRNRKTNIFEDCNLVSKLRMDKSFIDIMEETIYVDNVHGDSLNAKMKLKYNDMYEFLINDLEDAFKYFKEKFKEIIEIYMSIVTIITDWINSKLLHKIQYMAEYDSHSNNIIMKNFINSVSSRRFINRKNRIFIDFISKF